MTREMKADAKDLVMQMLLQDKYTCMFTTSCEPTQTFAIQQHVNTMSCGMLLLILILTEEPARVL